MRKIYLDNIRWCTISLVVFFHVFFFFNNIGITAIFEGLPEYHQGDGMTFAGLMVFTTVTAACLVPGMPISSRIV